MLFISLLFRFLRGFNSIEFDKLLCCFFGYSRYIYIDIGSAIEPELKTAIESGEIKSKKTQARNAIFEEICIGNCIFIGISFFH